MMNIDPDKKYFLMSFRFDKNKAEDFGLVQSSYDDSIFIDKSDNSEWLRKNLYDFGWGNEYGFMRLPKLDFHQLWTLLETSRIQENRYGAAHVLENEYADPLMSHLLGILNDRNMPISKSLKEAFKILRLETAKNRSKGLGKSFTDIDIDSGNWKYISERVNDILKQ